MQPIDDPGLKRNYGSSSSPPLPNNPNCAGSRAVSRGLARVEPASVNTLVAFAAVVVLGLILKLLFGRRRDTTTVTRPPTEPDDFGLLSPAAILDCAEDAYAFRRLLEQAGIRATTTITLDGRYHNKLSPLRDTFSEFALIRYRVLVEIEWLKALGWLSGT